MRVFGKTTFSKKYKSKLYKNLIIPTRNIISRINVGTTTVPFYFVGDGKF